MPTFAERVIAWQAQYGRHDLPWQHTTDAYRIWLAEIMLQQTQVATVIPYYQRFLQDYPTVDALAEATLDDVLVRWAGLGYYARARNLHRCAQIVAHQFAGVFPTQAQELQTLPGIGRSTAAAIAAFSVGARAAILDGNVKRVLTRHFAIAGVPTRKPVETQLWDLAQALLPAQNMPAYTQGLMDLGATVCLRRQPNCRLCPLQSTCSAYQTGQIQRFPEKAVRVTLPHKHTHMLVLLWHDQVWLEQRPVVGIWGGLWSLPETATPPTQASLAQAGYTQIQALEALPAVRHSFTHFHLHIQPWRVVLQQPPERIMAGSYRWVSRAGLKEFGLPKPVQTILSKLT